MILEKTEAGELNQMNSSHLGKVTEVSLPSSLLCFTNPDACFIM